MYIWGDGGENRHLGIDENVDLGLWDMSPGDEWQNSWQVAGDGVTGGPGG